MVEPRLRPTVNEPEIPDLVNEVSVTSTMPVLVIVLPMPEPEMDSPLAPVDKVVMKLPV